MIARTLTACVAVTVITVGVSGCSATQPDTEGQATEAPSTNAAELTVANIDGAESRTFSSLEELRETSEIIVVGTVTGEQEGPVTDHGDERITERRLEVAVDEVLKGELEVGDSILWYDAFLSEVREPEGDDWGDPSLMVSSENHGFEVGERAILALAREAQGDGTWGLHSKSAFFLLDEAGEVIPTERSNPAAEEAQAQPVEELKAQLHVD